jgi:hypothetical protein
VAHFSRDAGASRHADTPNTDPLGPAPRRNDDELPLERVMGFPIQPDSEPSFFNDLFSPKGGYYKRLRDKLKTHPTLEAKFAEGLFDDYCVIGSFLTKKAAVLAALEPLEKALRAAVEQSQHKQALGTNIKQSGSRLGAQNAVFKCHKLLTNALSLVEIQNGFNNPDALSGSVNSDAYQYNPNTNVWEPRFKVTTDNQGKDTRVALKDTRLMPGVPTVVGGISGLDFNNILLRHGYQFKDVGANFRHGEYAHRLQWYAICQGNLPLYNTPLQIYKSMGYLLAGGDEEKNLKNQGLHLYIWETLFDAGKDPAQAHNVLKTPAWTNGTFNSPEVLTAELIDIKGKDVNKESDLWYLRALVRARYYKRFLEGPGEPGDRTYETKSQTRGVATAFSSFDMSKVQPHQVTRDQAFGHVPALIWYLSK